MVLNNENHLQASTYLTGHSAELGEDDELFAKGQASAPFRARRSSRRAAGQDVEKYMEKSIHRLFGLK